MDEMLNRKKEQFKFSHHEQEFFDQPEKIHSLLAKNHGNTDEDHFRRPVTANRERYGSVDRTSYQNQSYDPRVFNLPYESYRKEINEILNRNSHKEGESGYSSSMASLVPKKSYLEDMSASNRVNSHNYDKVMVSNTDNKKKSHIHCFSNSNLQKENIMRRAEEEASKKIQEIERKARMKVIEKKSSTGYKWKWGNHV